jgi:hypothetical protein
MKFQHKGDLHLFSIITELKITIIWSTFLWGIALCSPLKVNQRFGGTCCFHLQGWKISRARKQCESNGRKKQTLKLELTCCSETRLTFNRLHGMIFQKTGFKMTAVWTPGTRQLFKLLVCFYSYRMSAHFGDVGNTFLVMF